MNTADNGSFILSTGNIIGFDCILIMSHSGFAGKMIAISNIPQTIHLDTIRLEPRTLEEVVISANRILPDRQLFFPSKVAVKRSTTGFDLLQNMTIPGVHVDMEKQKVEKRGFGKIPIYINEKPASAMDVVALRPDEVVRVDYIDRPGVEYGLKSPTAVINFVVKPRISGLAIGANLHNAVTPLDGRNYFYAQINKKLSKWGVFYMVGYSKMKDRKINQTDRYTFIDGEEHHVDREGIKT